jgi:hypothetical protein
MKKTLFLRIPIKISRQVSIKSNDNTTKSNDNITKSNDDIICLEALIEINDTSYETKNNVTFNTLDALDILTDIQNFVKTYFVCTTRGKFLQNSTNDSKFVKNQINNRIKKTNAIVNLLFRQNKITIKRHIHNSESLYKSFLLSDYVDPYRFILSNGPILFDGIIKKYKYPVYYIDNEMKMDMVDLVRLCVYSQNISHIHININELYRFITYCHELLFVTIPDAKGNKTDLLIKSVILMCRRFFNNFADVGNVLKKISHYAYFDKIVPDDRTQNSCFDLLDYLRTTFPDEFNNWFVECPIVVDSIWTEFLHNNNSVARRYLEWALINNLVRDRDLCKNFINFVDNFDNTCHICMDETNTILKTCKHYMCTGCIMSEILDQSHNGEELSTYSEKELMSSICSMCNYMKKVNFGYDDDNDDNDDGYDDIRNEIRNIRNDIRNIRDNDDDDDIRNDNNEHDSELMKGLQAPPQRPNFFENAEFANTTNGAMMRYKLHQNNFFDPFYRRNAQAIGRNLRMNRMRVAFDNDNKFRDEAENEDELRAVQGQIIGSQNSLQIFMQNERYSKN